MGATKIAIPRRERKVRVRDVAHLRFPGSEDGMIELGVYIGRQIVHLQYRVSDAPPAVVRLVRREIQRIAEALIPVMPEAAHEVLPRVPRRKDVRPRSAKCHRKRGRKCGDGDVCSVLSCPVVRLVRGKKRAQG